MVLRRRALLRYRYPVGAIGLLSYGANGLLGELVVSIVAFTRLLRLAKAVNTKNWLVRVRILGV